MKGTNLLSSQVFASAEKELGPELAFVLFTLVETRKSLFSRSLH